MDDGDLQWSGAPEIPIEQTFEAVLSVKVDSSWASSALSLYHNGPNGADVIQHQATMLVEGEVLNPTNRPGQKI